ncbi:MAG: hypothetical protein ACREGF_01415 [Candidatus Saccharimonadales bacterium]
MNTVDLMNLQSRLRGPVIGPDDATYDPERTGFNLDRPHRPALIAGALDADDVAAAFAFAREHDLPLGVQATGHGHQAAFAGAQSRTHD